MSLIPLLPIQAPEELAELVLPTWAFPAIAAGFFLLLAIISWSYRDVAHRHNDKTSGAVDSGASDSHDAHH
jgi:hypothetical protein